MKKLTVREKYLIFLALAALMTGIGYYSLELPSEAAFLQAKTEYQLAQAEYDVAEKLLEEAEDRTQELESCLQYCLKLQDSFGPVLNDYELERKISGLLEANGLVLMEAQINETEPVVSGENSLTPVFYKGSMKVKVNGNAQDFYNLLDELDNRKDMVVTSFAMKHVDQEAEFDIEIACFMLAEETRPE